MPEDVLMSVVRRAQRSTRSEMYPASWPGYRRPTWNHVLPRAPRHLVADAG